MEMLLKTHGYSIKYSNLSVFDKFASTGGKLYAGTVIEKLETLLLKARLAHEKKKYYHFFVYYSGHGQLSSTTKETCGVDSYGDMIALENYSKKFSQYKNTLSIFFLECNREKFEDPTKSPPLEESKAERKGISIVKYGCEPKMKREKPE
jgi:hypothetical protein